MNLVRECGRKHRAGWRVTVYKANYSAFNGGHYTPSQYSELACLRCGRRWRTRAAYVESTPRLS